MAFNAGDIESTLTLDRSPFHRGLSQARAEAARFEREVISIRVDLDKSELDRLGNSLGSARQSGARSGINIPVRVDKGSIRAIQDDVEDIARNTETTARRSGNRIARLLLNPLVIQLGLLPGVAAASVALSGAALAALPVAFGAVAAAALKNNESLKSSWAEMWQDLKTEAEAAAEPLLGTFEDLAGDIFGTWRQLRPELSQIFQDSIPLIESFTDGVLGMAEEAVPRFGTALQQSGPAMRGFESLLRSIGVGMGDMAINVAQNSVDTGRSLELLGQFVENLLADVGSLIQLFTSWWADVGPQFNRVFDTFTNTLLTFTEGGLRGTSQGMTVLLGVVEALLNVIGPFADIFGQMGGYALAAIGTWKLLAGTLGLVGKAWGLLSPGNVSQKLDGVRGTIDKLSQAGGVWIQRATGSAMAGAQFSNVMTKVGSAVTKAAAAIPLIGVGVAGLMAVFDHFFPSADTLAEKIMQGGVAAEEARSKMYGLEGGYDQTNLAAALFAERSDDVIKAIEKQRAGMTDLERAQQDLIIAENNYQLAVDRHGKGSEQAQTAQRNLAFATDAVAFAQERAADATKTHTDRIIEQTNLMLGAIGARLNYNAALLQLEEQEKAVTEAIKAHGAGSLEARQADISYQQTLLSVVNAIGERVKAENMSQGETKATELATAAMRVEIARLAVAAGKNLPPALAEMASKLTDAELKAIGVTRSVDGTGRAIYRLPPGKTLRFPDNAPAAKRNIEALKGAIDRLPTQKWFTYFVKQEGNVSIRPKGLSDILIPPRAEGGPVSANSPYWVGEKGLPELFFPNVDGFILNGSDSAKVMDQAGDRNTRNKRLRLDDVGGDGASSPDFDSMVAAFRKAMSEVLSDAKLRVDKSEWAAIVNESNNYNARR